MPVGRSRLRKKDSIKESIQEVLRLVPEPEKLAEELPKVSLQAQPQPEIQCTGAILLKAADSLIGGSLSIIESVKNSLKIGIDDIMAKTEGLIYLPLFEKSQENQISGLQALIGKNLSFEDIMSYHNDLQSVTSLDKVISQATRNVFKEARCMRIDFSNNESSYVDGNMYTVWSTPHTPYSFSTTICNTSRYINRHFKDNAPLVLFTAPGHNVPTKEFFNFILGLELKGRDVAGLKIYGNKLEELNSIQLNSGKKRFFVFAMWPWQFVDYRKILNIGEFKPFVFEPVGLKFFLSEIEIEISQPDAGQSVTLKGCAIRNTLSEKTRMVILSNLVFDSSQPEKLANIYLSRWPNLGETFKDYSRKIEFFTYTGNSQRFLSAECAEQLQNPPQTKAIFENYLQILDLYVRWYFLPEVFKDKCFPEAKQHFYSLNTILKRGDGCSIVKFYPPAGYPFLKELEYACHRINEREIIFADSSRLWCLL
ncbi:MAG: hypothetical protein PHT50_02535 [Candidatus Omnitrophica bacterium]|nr:hypothetical protein [Candidatus Omnitrophota bacterium]